MRSKRSGSGTATRPAKSIATTKRISTSDRSYYRGLAKCCRNSFKYFVKKFWECVPGAGRVKWNWHLDVFCAELQRAAESVFDGRPRDHDLILNVSPGTSKSTVWSILFPAWVWTRMPNARVITASHTEELVLDLSTKSKAVIESEKYQKAFPEIKLAKANAGYYTNTAGGDRKTCTVGGKSPTGFHAHFIIIDDPIDPKKMMSEAEVKVAKAFMTDVIPSRKVDKAVSVTMLIMQRMGIGDPTDVMLEGAKKEGAAKVRHICLPSELVKDDSGNFVVDDVQPPEYASYYLANKGLMDPVRLDAKVLGEFKAKGAHYYATQFLQKPFAKEGGMFKDWYFNMRKPAAPYAAKRIRYWDRASTEDGGCYTAGVLMAFDGNSYYVEHVVHGQWEPEERNKTILATALRDRGRYGPKHEPLIYIEEEGGSVAKDANRGLARTLAGFRIRFDRVSGRKEVRAEPWACQLAAENVYMVEDKTWDLEGYIKEHLAFPLGTYKDQVDASSGAFNLLCRDKVGSPLRIYTFKDRGSRQKLPVRVLVAAEDDLLQLHLTEPCLVVSFSPPPPLARETPPFKGLEKAETLRLEFIDACPEDYQENWQQPIPPYELPPEKLVMTRDQGAKLWAFLLKRRSPAPGIIILQDDGEGDVAMSAALGVVDAMRLPRNEAIYRLSDEQWKAKPDTVPGNLHVWATVKMAKNLVVS